MRPEVLTKKELLRLSGEERKKILSRELQRYIHIDKKGCWIYNSAPSVVGHKKHFLYRTDTGKRKYIKAHRLAYILYVEKIGKDTRLFHNCANPACCNPKHLIKVDKIVARTKCNRCSRTNLTNDDFYWKDKNRTMQQSHCKKCSQQYSQRHFRMNRDHLLGIIKKHKKINQKKAKKYINSIKNKIGVCLDCGIKYPLYVYDFDHVHGKKEYDVSTMPKRGCSINLIAKEIAKCEIVCSNCHRIRTHKRRVNKQGVVAERLRTKSNDLG